MESEKYDARLKLVVPGQGQIEIKGTGEFVDMFFGQISMRFTQELEKAVKNFKGDLEMAEIRNGKKVEIEIFGKERRQ